MRFKGFALAGVLTGALILVPGFCAASPAGDAAAGKEVFMKKCKICHGSDGQGNEGMAKLLKVTIPPLDSPKVQSKSDADLKKVILEGSGKMKPVKDMSDADVNNVIAFVRTLKKK
jgi:mono/diheme cytochrome c family protein